MKVMGRCSVEVMNVRISMPQGPISLFQVNDSPNLLDVKELNRILAKTNT